MSSPRDRRRRQVIEEAAAVFAERGFRKATLAEIAARSGLKRSALKRYFDSKEELFAAVVRLQGESLVEAVREAVDAASGAEAKLDAFAKTRLAAVRRLASFDEAVRREVSGLQPLVLHAFKEFRVQLQEILEGILRGGMADGDFGDEDDVELLARGLLFFIRGVDAAVLYEGEAAGVELAQRALLGVVVRGLRRRAGAKVIPFPRRR